MSTYDAQAVREQFDLLKAKPELVFLDTAASAQKPKTMLEAMENLQKQDYANVHRGLYSLSQKSTQLYENAREITAKFLGTKAQNIVFTSGTTESLNLVAQSYGTLLKPAENVLISTLEHHSNIVPWQMLISSINRHDSAPHAGSTGADSGPSALQVVPLNERGEITLENFKNTFTPGNTKLVAISHMSNALGSITPLQEVIDYAHSHGALVCVDGTQAVVHMDVNVEELDADFYTFSAHKLYGPTGIGVLHAKPELLAKMPPVMGGGEMIKEVTLERSTYAEGPAKFEAGTPNIVGAIGMAAAIEWFQQQVQNGLHAYEAELHSYALEQLAQVAGLRMIGTAQNKGAILNFVIDGCHPQDVAMMLDEQNICVRTGHHCAQPTMAHFGISGTIRASIGAYTTYADIDKLVAGLQKAVKILKR